MWEFVDKVVYINLDHRQDRRDIMKKFFEDGQIPPEKIQRFPAIKHSTGDIGCSMSHAAVVRMAKRNGWKNVLVLEDDLKWLDFEQGYKQLEDLVSRPDWNVIMLVGWYSKYKFPRIYSAANTGAYLVNSNYYDALIRNREEGIRAKTSWRRWATASNIRWNADVWWCKLMSTGVWYGLYPCICCQTNTYSDISKLTYNAEGVHGINVGKGNLFKPIQNAEQQNSKNRK